MPFALSEAVLRCTLRRAGRALRQAPLLAVGLLVALIAAPFVAVRAGGALGRAVGSSFAQPAFAQSFPASLLLASLTAGVLAAAVTPRLAHLDDQLRTTPPSRAMLFLAVTVVPLLVPLLLLGALAAAFFAAFGRGTPAGVGGGLVLMLGCAAALAVGAGLAESMALLRSRPSVAVPTGLVLAIAWTASSLVVPGWVLYGPAALLGEVLVGAPGRLVPALLVLCGLGVLGCAAFLRGVSAEPGRSGSGRLALPALLPVAGPVWLQHVVVELKVLGRRPDLRRNAQSVLLATPLVGLVLQQASPLPELSVSFAGLLAVLGSAAYPLAAASLDRPSPWLWQVPARTPRSRLVAPLVAALLAQLAVVLVAGAVLVLVLGLPVNALGSILGATVLVGALGLVAGTVLPWRPDSAVDQAASYAALLALCAAVYLPLGRVVRRLQEAGLDDRLLLGGGAALLLLTAVVVASSPHERQAVPA